MIKVTENAKTQALQLMKDDGNEGYFIRVGVKAVSYTHLRAHET